MKLISRHGLLLLLALYTVPVSAQDTWNTFSSTTKDFQIELPKSATMKSVKVDYEEEAMFDLFGRGRKGSNFEIKLVSENQPKTFNVVVFYPLSARSDKKFVQEANNNMLFLFGDDKTFSKEVDVKVSSLQGREFVFAKGGQKGRAMFVNAGRRIYMVSYFEEGDDITAESALANRIFGGFRVNK